MTYDICIIGGGIVGAATAMEILTKKKLSLVILEKEKHLAAHQTGNNSGVIHSGLYYKPGSLKALNCVRGREKLYAFCKKYNIPHEQCGKIVIAVNNAELSSLEELYRRGLANGLNDIKKLTSHELKTYEPHAVGIAGLYIPATGIVDYKLVTEQYAALAKQQGGELRLRHKVLAIRIQQNRFILETCQGNIFCKHLINCAGLYSDTIARMCGLNPGLRIIPFRGEYYTLTENKRNLVKNLIYPVPDPRFPFLGVHFTRMINGGVEAGPNAVLALRREGYSKTSFSLKDTLGILCYPGFWKMALTYWKMGFAEMYRSLNKKAFVRELQKMLPGICTDDLVPGGAGVRAQALLPNGTLADDFRILETGNMIHVLNAPSPAATASLSIGETIANIALKKFSSKVKIFPK